MVWGRRDWLWATISFLATVAVLNVLAWVVIREVDAPSPYFARLEPSLKTKTLKAYIQAGGPPSIVTIGSSVADMGFDVMQLDKQLRELGIPARSFNFGVNGAGTVVFRELLERVIIPIARPKVIIYGLSPIEFNQSSAIFLKDQANFLSSAGVSITRDGISPATILKRRRFRGPAALPTRGTGLA